LANDEIVEGVLTALTPTAGDKVFWTFDGTTGGLSLTAPSGASEHVWRVGVAKNADDLHVEVVFVKKNKA
jgi:hypothetical protein